MVTLTIQTYVIFFLSNIGHIHSEQKDGLTFFLKFSPDSN